MAEAEEFIEEMFEKGILVHKGLLEKELNPSLLDKAASEKDILVLNEDYAGILLKGIADINWYETDNYRVHAEKERDDGMYQSHLQHIQRTTLSSPEFLSQTQQTTSQPAHHDLTHHNVIHHDSRQQVSSLEVVLEEKALEDGTASYVSDSHVLEAVPKAALETEAAHSELSALSTSMLSTIPEIISVSYANQPRKFAVEDFTSLFISRYTFLQGLLRTREELQNILPLNRILAKKERSTVSIICMVSATMSTKSGNIILTVEDMGGEIKVIISRGKNTGAEDIVPDEVIGITGTYNNGVIFADSIVWPDIPHYESKKNLSAQEEYAIFLSDLHVGSSLFLHEEFQRFIAWISGNAGNEQQRSIASKVKYIFIAGDVVDGIGIYPGQETELAITNITSQYEELSKLLSQIPQDKKIIIGPGNHDIIHLAEPQSLFYKEYASSLYALPNITIVSNPAYITIGKTASFPGYDILMYHGYSFDYYVATVDSLRNNGGYHRADLIMKFLLKRRHLAPSFKSTPYFPGQNDDPLLIRKVPDFFITGHIHYSNIGQYKGVTTISCSCWQGKTTFQEKLGHEPEPARVPIVNLQNREIKVLRF